MRNFGIYLLWTLAACSLWGGSLAEDQCDNFCVTELRPLINQVINSQGNTHNAVNKTEANVERLVDQQAKLETNLVALQTKLDGQQAALTKIENQLQAILKKMEGETDFEQVGSRYFQVVNEITSWETAEARCRDLGGYLATFRNTEEIVALKKQLSAQNAFYWIGLNDRDNEGHFVSVASKKPANFEFLEWFEGTPRHNQEQNCVALCFNKLWNTYCNMKFPFICQVDKEN